MKARQKCQRLPTVSVFRTLFRLLEKEEEEEEEDLFFGESDSSGQSERGPQLLELPPEHTSSHRQPGLKCRFLTNARPLLR